MEKLEKALEKARRQRDLNKDNPTAPGLAEAQQRSALGPSSRPAASTALPPPTFGLDEETLAQNRIIAHHVKDPQADVYRILRAQVLTALAKEGHKTLAIVSPSYGDGKTTTAINLALSIALDQKQTVLLADLDLRKPSIAAYLGLPPQQGLTDCLDNKATLSDCLVRLPYERMVVLPSGTPLDHSSEVLGSPRMALLADEMRTRYADRLIIYDVPPLLEQDDPLAFLPHVDAVLLVLREAVTRTSDLKRCLDILANANVIGTVLNCP